jgi:hypothetical protein
MDFKNDFGVRIAPHYSKNRAYPNSNNDLYGRTKGLKINCDYTIKPSREGFPLLFFGRVKFDKPVTIKATFNYTDRLNYTDKASGVRSISQDDRRIDFNLSGAYTFSNMVSGKLEINFSHYLNRRNENTTSIIYGGSFDVRIKF